MSKIGFVDLGIRGTPMAEHLRFNACAALGGKAWDHSAMVHAQEKLANFEIGQPAAQAN